MFEDEEEPVSCVLVYREYSDETITVKEYHKGTKFPQSVAVGDPDKYTFAVFGKNGYDIDETPIVSGRAEPITTSSNSGMKIYSSRVEKSHLIFQMSQGLLLGLLLSSLLLLCV